MLNSGMARGSARDGKILDNKRSTFSWLTPKFCLGAGLYRQLRRLLF